MPCQKEKQKCKWTFGGMIPLKLQADDCVPQMEWRKKKSGRQATRSSSSTGSVYGVGSVFRKMRSLNFSPSPRVQSGSDSGTRTFQKISGHFDHSAANECSLIELNIWEISWEKTRWGTSRCEFCIPHMFWHPRAFWLQQNMRDITFSTRQKYFNLVWFYREKLRPLLRSEKK